jgi:hypothetical protein
MENFLRLGPGDDYHVVYQNAFFANLAADMASGTVGNDGGWAAAQLYESAGEKLQGNRERRSRERR